MSSDNQRFHGNALYHLSTEERAQFCEEMIRVAEALDKAFRPDKMNYELLGNMSAHMHWHLIPRYGNDEFWDCRCGLIVVRRKGLQKRNTKS